MRLECRQQEPTSAHSKISEASAGAMPGLAMGPVAVVHLVGLFLANASILTMPHAAAIAATRPTKRPP
jgi:hypothetical protein